MSESKFNQFSTREIVLAARSAKEKVLGLSRNTWIIIIVIVVILLLALGVGIFFYKRQQEQEEFKYVSYSNQLHKVEDSLVLN